MAFIAGFLLDGKKCKRLYGHNYEPHFCVYAIDIIICILILALLVTQAFMVKFICHYREVHIYSSGILVPSRRIGSKIQKTINI